MSTTTFRRAIEAVKDKTSIGIAKLNHRTSLLSDLSVAIVKATKHDEYPAAERHVSIILNLTCYSRPYMRSCVKAISRRLRNTSNWVVAIKTLILIHRLLRDGHVAFEHEFLFATRHGTCLLKMTDFSDKSRTDSWNYTVFVRTYALYLNDQLRRKVQNRKGSRGRVSTTRDERKEKVKPGAPVEKKSPVLQMKTEEIFLRLNGLMQTLELFLNCRPAGSAKTNRVLVMALHTLIKESFITYNDIAETVGVLIDRFEDLDTKECLKVHGTLYLLSKQFDELDAFYRWSISSGIVRSSEYPEVMKIPVVKLDEIKEYIKQKSENESEPEGEEQNTYSLKALPPAEGLPEEKESEAKVVIGDLINFEDDDDDDDDNDDDDATTTEEHPDKQALFVIDDAPTTEHPDQLALCVIDDAPTTEHPDQLALCVIDDAPTTEHPDQLALCLIDDAPTTEHPDQLALCIIDDAPTGPATAPSPWVTFNDSADWETTLEASANSLSTQKETHTWGSDWLMSDDNMHHQQGAVNNNAMQPMLTLPAPPVAQNAAASTTKVYPYYSAPMVITPQPFVQMSGMEMKDRLALEPQVMWQTYARDGMQGLVAYEMVQPHPYMYNQGGYTSTY